MQNQTVEQVIKALAEANNVMVTVKNSPSVDELAAAIALTLILNHLNKHAITVFSGRVPSTLEFLQPEMAIDTNTDSLRDFIIALDKSKADKLRYKVEDNVVRIFITPYKTSISEKDLEFSQGDFNVDVVVALGVVTREDFDQAVMAHGRILHDATVLAVTKREVISQIGTLNWQDPQASSISEMITGIADGLGENVLDGQIATALLTGIVAETDRFKNANTTPQVLSLSSKLMAAGANQQLIAEKLEEPETHDPVAPLLQDDNNDGALEIPHDDEPDVQNIHIDESGNLQLHEEPASEETPVAPLVDGSEQGMVIDTSRPYLGDQPAAQQLFGQDDGGQISALPMLEDPHTDLDEASQTGLSHQRKTIEPLAEDSVVNDGQEETNPDLPPPDVIAAPSQDESATDSFTTSNDFSVEQPPELPQEGSDPQANADNQTLADLERSVGMGISNDNSASQDAGAAPQPSVDDFLGTTRVMESAETSENASQETNDSSVATDTVPSPPVDADKPVAENDGQEDSAEPEDPLLQPPPQVINPSAPPAVPPPLMPQAPSQPQFYEADGTNTNPFLNPN